jgi:hypothetical protein
VARIVTVYPRDPTAEDVLRRHLAPLSMAYIRWFKISEQLAALGHDVDLAVPDRAIDWPATQQYAAAAGMRCVALSRIDWRDYDAVKTVFHRGFDTLAEFGGDRHPFIISKLGSVVGPRDMEGIYFYGEIRERLYATQERIRRASRYVTVLSPQARALWEECFGDAGNTLLVPGAVDATVPAAVKDPYPADGVKRVLFAGNIYTPRTQPEANVVLVDKLNRLGELLSRGGARLYMLGSGDLSRLDSRYVSTLGAVEYAQTWDYFHHADVGVVVAAGPFHHNNESTKIYHYLRAGLPVVSEAGFPNDHVVTESRLGFVVESDNMEALATRVLEAARCRWDRDCAIRYILDHHTWQKRVLTYAPLLANGVARSAS